VASVLKGKGSTVEKGKDQEAWVREKTRKDRRGGEG
jgi:hypothetical protein